MTQYIYQIIVLCITIWVSYQSWYAIKIDQGHGFVSTQLVIVFILFVGLSLFNAVFLMLNLLIYLLP